MEIHAVLATENSIHLKKKTIVGRVLVIFSYQKQVTFDAKEMETYVVEFYSYTFAISERGIEWESLVCAIHVTVAFGAQVKVTYAA